ncbi:MAG: xylulokinase [Acidimicrobiia bacterium]
MAAEVTVGIDIGTTSVKAIAADGDGGVVARARVPHRLVVPTPDRLEHDAGEAWRRGPQAALTGLGVDPSEVKGVSVAAMVPSLTAVDDAGVPITPGLLYGDERGRTGSTGSPVESGELVAFLRWSAREAPDAHGFWPAQAVANDALSGEAVLDTSTAATAFPLFDWTSWDEKVAAENGARTDQLPRLVPTAWEAGRVGGDGPPLASGCIDALAEQLVAGADDHGDVLVILGTTLIVWVVTEGDASVSGYFTIPHTAAGKMLVGGPSNAGGLFLNWVTALVGEADGGAPDDPGRVPLWAPYPRGERVPFHDAACRAALTELDLTHDASALRRAAYEASGFCARRMIDASGVDANRIVATGGGTRVDEWVRSLADATGLPVDCVAVPEGGALGSAWLARIAAGLEDKMAMPEGRRWARTGRRVEPDSRWRAAVAERYERFLALP